MAYDEHIEPYHDPRFKTKNWCMICYLENMREDWESDIETLLDCPGFYGIHAEDVDSKGEPRKPHIHLSIFWTGNINCKAAINIANRLSKLGAKCCSVGKPINRIRNNYDYAIHDTDAARKDGKVQYGEECRKCFGGFDIGFYEQLSQVDKDQITFEIAQFIGDNKIKNLERLRREIMEHHDMQWFLVFKANNGFFDRLCRGVYLELEEGKASREILDKPDMEPGLVAMSEAVVRDRNGDRCVVCSECGEVKHEEDFVTFGGKDGVNIGICRDCYHRKREE